VSVTEAPSWRTPRHVVSRRRPPFAEGVPVVTVTRVAHREDGTPVEMNDMVLAADRYQLSYEWAAD
jgi:hypothetical protein